MPTGIVTGTDQLDVWAWVARRLFAGSLYKDHAGTVVLARIPKLFESIRDRVLIVPESDSAGLDEFFSFPLQGMVSEFHSKETCARWGDSILCGMHLGRSAEETPVNMPGCDEGENCLWSDTRPLPVQAINAVHNITLSCATLRLGDHLSDPRAGIGLSIFGGRARSLLSPFRFVNANTWLTFYLADLLSSGVPLGQIMQLGNEYQVEHGSDQPSLVLLGDPEDAAVEGPLPRGLSEIPPTALVVLDKVPEADDSELSECAVSIEAQNPLLARNLKLQMAAGILPSEFTNCSKNDDFADIDEPDLLANLLPINQLAELDCSDGMWLPLRYQGPKVQHSVIGSVNCPHCANQAAVRHGYKVPPAPQGREVVICARCGIVVDYPTPRDTEFQLEISSKTTAEIEFEVSVTGSEPIKYAAIMVSLMHAHRFDWHIWPRLIHCGPLNTHKQIWNIREDVPVGFPGYALNLRVVASLDGVPYFRSAPVLLDSSRVKR